MAESYSVTAVLKAKVDGFVNGFKQATSSAEKFVEKNKATFDSFKQVGVAATAGGVAIAAGLGATVKIASDFQSSFAGVRKTVDASPAEFKALETGIRNMAKELPASANSIAEVAEAAGQLGIEKENILAFSRTMIDLGEATNLTADEAATAFAQFANVVGMPQDNFDRLGSSVVALGNTMATTEADIVSMAMRLSGTGAQVGLTEAEIMALSATMSSVGINAEAGGSAMSTVMKKISNAVADGGKDMGKFAKAADMSSSEFSKAWKDDPITALDAFIKGLGESGESGENLNAILGDLGIKGIQETDTLLRLAGASDLLSGAVDTSTTAWEKNTALTEEAAQRYETFESKTAMLKNTITDIAISIGNVLLPVVTTMVEFVQKLAEKFSNLDDKTITIIAVIAALAAGFLLLIGPIFLLIGFIPSMLAGFTALTTVIGAISGPIVLAVAAIIAIGAALVIAYNKFEWFREVVDAVWQAIVSAIMLAVDGVVAFVQNIADQISTYWNENGELIRAATENVWNAIKTVIETVMPIIEGIIKVAWFVIQTIVMSVWENIKGVIQGALDIILGLVKVFAGLFTGDWSAMWDGIKQMFSGVVKFLWNLVQLMLWGKLLKGIAVFAGAFRGAASTMWGAVRGVFTNAINAIRNFFTNGFNTMRNVANTSMSSIRSLISTIWNAIRNTFTTVVNGIKNIVTTGFSRVVSTIRTKMTDSVNVVKGAVSKFFSAGKDLISGLIKGIKNMGAAAIGAITGVVDGVVNKAKSLLGIKSPSRVFMAIGGFISEGAANGINKARGLAVKASEALGLGVENAFNPQLATDGIDIAGQVDSINRQANRQMENHLTSELTVTQRQPAYIHLSLGMREYETFVEDISDTQNRHTTVKESFR